MDTELKVPPVNKQSLSPPEKLADKLACLVGQRFKLTGKSRTDGSNIRKLIAATLLANNPPEGAKERTYKIVPLKGVPKILLEYVDTYIVTSGESYNLQVWNRNPDAESVQVQYKNGETLQSGEVRFVLVNIDPKKQVIRSVLVLTPDYIVKNFGPFGKPIFKNQLIISPYARQHVLAQEGGILFYEDDKLLGNKNNAQNLSKYKIQDMPSDRSLLPLFAIKRIIKQKIVGQSIAPAATKNRGQMLEEKIANVLGYKIKKGEMLAADYPDIRNQALEVKIQDSPTVDLGKYSPEFEETIPNCKEFTTRNMRYLIALTNSETNIVEGAVLCPGSKLGRHFTYVSQENYKCQRSMAMAFFEKNKGRSIFNP